MVLAGLNLCAETLDGIRNHSWSRPAPATVEGEIVSWADRIAYCAHDLEDAVHAGIVAPTTCPTEVAEVCGRTRREQLNTFVRAVVQAVEEHGEVGMPPAEAGALAALRAFNYERIYVRPASLAQSRGRGRRAAGIGGVLRRAPGLRCQVSSTWPQPTPPSGRAVTYVAGMTDRYAFDMAVRHLNWPPERLPHI